MRRLFGIMSFSAMLALATGNAAFADDPPAAGEPPAKEQPQRPRDRGGMRVMGGGQAMYDRMAEELGLSDEQKSQYKEIVTAHFREQREKQTADGGPFAKMRDLRERFMEARQSGNEEELKKLREEMQAIAAEQQKMMAESRKQLHDKINAILTAEQKTKFEEIEQQMMNRRRGEDRGPDPAMLRRALSQIEMGPQQKAKIAAIFEHVQEEAKKDAREQEEGRGPGEQAGQGEEGQRRRPGPGGPGGRRRERPDIGRKIYDEVVKELTPEQRKQLDEMLGRAEGGGPLKNRPQRPRARGERGQQGEQGEQGEKGQPGEQGEQKPANNP